MEPKVIHVVVNDEIGYIFLNSFEKRIATYEFDRFYNENSQNDIVIKLFEALDIPYNWIDCFVATEVEENGDISVNNITSSDENSENDRNVMDCIDFAFESYLGNVDE